jgi:tagaturonate epimerase
MSNEAVEPAEVIAARFGKAGATGSSIVAGNPAVAVGPGRFGWELIVWASLPEALAGVPGGEATPFEGGTLLRAPAGHEQAAWLRDRLPWLRPRKLGLAPSAGVGDRLGLATPGHVAAFRAAPGVAPVLAQQSARELGRTGRTFQDVVDAATFGALASGWRSGYGADADHLKNTDDIDAGIAAGCTMFTADPIELVPNLAAEADPADIARAYEQVRWPALEDDEASFLRRYPAALALETGQLPLPEAALRAAAARFAPAVLHVAAMYRHLVGKLGEDGFEFEVAVDEILHRTTHVDHVYLATELHRLGVRWVGLAPRFVGRFEKGIDFIGDPAELAADVAVHSAVARAMGGYKISVHSGSDKFSTYEGIARATRGAVHLKTSGTSYLVALGVVAAADPDLMRRVWGVALGAYAKARASYHVSASVSAAGADPDRLSPTQLAALLADPETREVLHVTYGAVLNGDGPDADLGQLVRSAVWLERERYWRDLASHIGRHVSPFAAVARSSSQVTE